MAPAREAPEALWRDVAGLGGRPHLLKLLVGVGRLMRVIPVIAWSMTGIFLGMAAAVAETGVRLPRTNLILVLAAAVLTQGYVAHAINDREDWRSGTDQRSTGILSGGTRVIPGGLLSPAQLAWIAWLTGFLFLAIGAYLLLRLGPAMILFVAAGLWCAITYTLPPLRLAYRPLAGEWLCGWLSVVAITTAAYFVFSGGKMSPLVLWLAATQGMFCLGWLMQHHIPDITADLEAHPQKLTTVAWVAGRLGRKRVWLVPALYFLLGAGLGLVAALLVHRAFVASVPPALAGAGLAWRTNPDSVEQVTRHQLVMIALTVFHALALGIWIWRTGVSG